MARYDEKRRDNFDNSDKMSNHGEITPEVARYLRQFFLGGEISLKGGEINAVNRW